MIVQRTTRLIVTGGALALLLGHLFHPEWHVDFVAVALLVVAVLPWLHHVFESVEASTTGVKVTYLKTKDALDDVAAGVTARTLQVTASAAVSPATGEAGRSATATPVRPGSQVNAQIQPGKPPWLRTEDANLALVGLRIEIEQRLRALGAGYGIESRTLTVLLNELVRKGVFDDRTVDALRHLIDAGNRAAHGARVDVDVTQLLRDDAPAVLDALDALLR